MDITPKGIWGEALKFLLSSKTMLIILVSFFLTAFVLTLATIAYNLGWEAPYVNDLVELIKWGIGFATGRNVISDGVMPRIPQAIGANRDPSVSIESPKSMSLSNKPMPEDVGPPQPKETPKIEVVQS